MLGTPCTFALAVIGRQRKTSLLSCWRLHTKRTLSGIGSAYALIWGTRLSLRHESHGAVSSAQSTVLIRPLQSVWRRSASTWSRDAQASAAHTNARCLNA